MWRISILWAALFPAGCDRFPDYRYKMTITVDTPQGEKTFSSVRQVRQRERFSIVDSNGKTVSSSLCGEALRMELNGRAYFAALSKPDNFDYAQHLAAAAMLPVVIARHNAKNPSGPAYSGAHNLDELADQQQDIVKVTGSRPLPRFLPARQGRPAKDIWPTIVTFDASGDPASVREVSPEAIGIKRIEIAITDDPVTEGAIGDLTWLDSHRGSLVRRGLDQPIGELPGAQRLTTAAFRRRNCD